MTDQAYPTQKQNAIPPFYQSSAWKRLRRQVLARDGRRCRYCGSIASQADHVIPRKKGGPDRMHNLVACCSSCNRVAGGRMFRSFAGKQTWILSARGIAKQDAVFKVTHRTLHPDDVTMLTKKNKTPRKVGKHKR